MKLDKASFRERRVIRWLPFGLLLLSLALYLPTVSKDRVVTDSQAAAASAWRIATSGRPWMEGVKASDLEGSAFPEMWLVETRHGHEVHNRTGGVILAGVPLYAALNRNPDPAGFQIWVGGIAAATVTAFAGLLMFQGLRTKVGDGAALGGTFALMFTTPVWSVSADALWTQNLTILAIAGAVLSVTRERWWATGLFFALGIFARAHFAIIAAVVGLYLGWRRNDWRIVLRVGLGSSLGLLALAAWNRMVFGFWSLRGGYEGYVTDNLLNDNSGFLYQFANTVGFLMAPDRGLLVWTPVVLLLLPSMLAQWRQLPAWTRAFVLAGVAYSIVQLRINSFQGGLGFYGYRLSLELLVCMAPALIHAYRATATVTRLVIGCLLGVQFAAIAIGSAADSYDLQDADIWTTNAFVVALGDHPWVYGLLTVVCAVLGMLITAAALRPSDRRQPAVV